jgi:hypothetical protein
VTRHSLEDASDPEEDTRSRDASGPTPIRRRRAELRAESFLRRHLVWGLVVFCYLYPFPYFQRLNNPNENVRIWQTRALVEYHELDIRKVNSDWGGVNDAAFAGDRLVSGKAPGASLLGIPVYFAQLKLYRLLGLPPPSQRSVTHTLRIWAVVLPVAAFLFFLARWVERETQSARARDLLVLGLGLGTPMYPYGLIFAGHVHGAALGFVAFALLAGNPCRAGPRLRLFLAGLSAGFAMVFEYQMAIVLAILCLWALMRYRGAAFWFLFGMLPAVTLLGGYHTILFGQPWAFPYAHLANESYAKNDHARGLFGLVLPSPTAFGDLLLSVRRGFFMFSPFLALGVWGALRSLWRARRGAKIVALAVTAAMFMFQAGMSNWTAGWSVGPRYIVVVAPMLAGAVAWCWRWTPERVLVPGVGGLVIASVFMCGLSGAYFPHFPETYDNPVFDLVVPLVLSGHAPHNLGRWFGLRGGWSMAPLSLVVAFGWVVSLGILRRGGEHAWRRRVGVLVLAGVIGCGHLVGLRLRTRDESKGNAEIESDNLVQSVWEPVP